MARKKIEGCEEGRAEELARGFDLIVATPYNKSIRIHTWV
jgi:hypothetical protein